MVVVLVVVVLVVVVLVVEDVDVARDVTLGTTMLASTTAATNTRFNTRHLAKCARIVTATHFQLYERTTRIRFRADAESIATCWRPAISSSPTTPERLARRPRH